MPRLRMAVIGVGHLGKEHARILSGMSDIELVGVVDVNADQAQTVARRCNTNAFSDYWPLLNRIDAAVLAVPTCYHYAVAGELLRRGIHLLVEKPLTDTVEHAEELVELSHRHGAILQVGHIERFNPAFEELQRRPLQAKFVECERLGKFTGRSLDIGVVLDLMIHDLDLLQTLVQAPVKSVDALGVSLFGKNEDVANARLIFTNGCVANITASRASTQPMRQMRIWSPEGFARVDFANRHLTLVQPSEQMRRQGGGAGKLDPAMLALLKTEMLGQHFEVLQLDCNHGDQLTRELQHFTQCVREGSRPRVSGEDGRDAIILATRILDSLRTHQWEGRADGPMGPSQLPAPLGPLFSSSSADEAAA